MHHQQVSECCGPSVCARRALLLLLLQQQAARRKVAMHLHSLLSSLDSACLCQHVATATCSSRMPGYGSTRHSNTQSCAVVPCQRLQSLTLL
jgi:hypothetical protein